MKDIKLFVAEMTFRDGVRLNGAQKEQLVPILEHFAREVWNEAIDEAADDGAESSIWGAGPSDIKESILKLKK